MNDPREPMADGNGTWRPVRHWGEVEPSILDQLVPYVVRYPSGDLEFRATLSVSDPGGKQYTIDTDGEVWKACTWLLKTYQLHTDTVAAFVRLMADELSGALDGKADESTRGWPILLKRLVDEMVGASRLTTKEASPDLGERGV